MRATRVIGTALLAGTVIVGVARPASADWLLNPFVGVTFEGEGSNKPRVYGGSVAFMGGGIVGLELDAAVAPDFFGSFEGLAETNLSTVMGNLIIGAPLGSPGARPYVSGGLGLIRARASLLDDLADVTEQSLGMNVGAGVIAFFSDHVGIRFDARYFRNMRDRAAGDDFDLALGNFDFWRATAGASIRF
jgi:opacity protein-like surface antigen